MKISISPLLRLYILVLSLLLAGSAQAKQLGVLIDTLDSRVLQGILAKEMCSCVFVDLSETDLAKEDRLKQCLKRGNLPVSEIILKIIMSLQVDSENSRVISNPRLITDIIGLDHFDTAIAQYEGRGKGCVLQ